MLKDKGVVVANPAMGMDHACALEPAVRGGAFMPQGCGRSEVRLKAVRSDAFGAWQIPRRCFRRALARSTLAAALASLLPLYSATAQETQVQDARDASTPAEEGRADGDPTQLDTVQVTGTRIKGGSVPSPVITIGSERIQEEGFTDLGEVIRSVPQNFSGGQNPGVIPLTISGAGVQNQNVTGGSSLNLRGLGPDATLTLLNGRRMAYGGFSQAVDVSAIPVEAVERIEIVADGASAIYGSDAVAGVANVILKRDFDGVVVGARYGEASHGGLSTREYTATGGATWATGGAIVTYKDVSANPVFARQRRYTDHLPEPYTIYPGSELRSGLLSFHQELGDHAELRLDGYRTEREQAYNIYNNLTRRNVLARPETTTSLVAPSVAFWLPRDWSLSAGLTWAESDHEQFQEQRALTGSTLSTIRDCYCNESRAYEIEAEGPLFPVGGDDVRLAVGAGYRRNTFLQFNRVAQTETARGEEGSRFAYAELSVPLMASEPGVPEAQRLTLTAAIRGEDYDSFGRISTPKVGLLYGPSADFTLKASWGKSFKAPTLFQRSYGQFAYLDPPEYYGGNGFPQGSTVLFIGGGNPDLGPERARTRSASVSFHPEALPNLEAELTWFDVNYGSRVVEPVADTSQALSNPNYAQFIDYSPTAQEMERITTTAQFYNFTGAPYDPDEVVAIIYAQFVNVARQKIKGLDLSGAYSFDLGAGRLTLRGSASWLDSEQKTTASTSAFDLAGTVYNPSRLNARAGVVWNRGGFTASTFANYKAGVRNVVMEERTSSFTTFDLTLRYATARLDGALAGWEVTSSVQNLFDRAPPLLTPATPYLIPPYDATNYSAIGRFLSVAVSKRW